MRTNNGKVKNVILSAYFILIVLAIVLAVAFRLSSRSNSDPLLTSIFIAIGFSALFLVAHFYSRYFEYDSDGVKVIVLNKGLLLEERLNYGEHVVEFSKEDLLAFKFRNFLIYRQLSLFIRMNGSKKWESFNVTLVPRRKRKYIRQSLSKMIKYNRKALQE